MTRLTDQLWAIHVHISKCCACSNLHHTVTDTCLALQRTPFACSALHPQSNDYKASVLARLQLDDDDDLISARKAGNAKANNNNVQKGEEEDLLDLLGDA